MQTHLRRGRAAVFIRRAIAYWSSSNWRAAWLLSLFWIASLGANFAVQYATVAWNKFFFDALARSDVATLWLAIILIAVVTLVGSLVGAVLIYSQTLFKGALEGVDNTAPNDLVALRKALLQTHSCRPE